MVLKEVLKSFKLKVGKFTTRNGGGGEGGLKPGIFHRKFPQIHRMLSRLYHYPTQTLH